MFKKYNLIILLSFLLLLVFINTALPARGEDKSPVDLELWPDLQYKVEYEFLTPEATGRMLEYVGDYRKRTEIQVGDEKYITIQFFNKEGVEEVILYTGEMQYIKSSYSYQEFMDEEEEYLISGIFPGEELDSNMQGEGYSSQKLGSEKLLGRTVEKWLLKVNEDGEQMEMIIWLDRKLRLMMKQEMAGEVIIQVTELEIGPQADQLFAIPEDYEPMF